jgi:hypothetical protein
MKTSENTNEIFTALITAIPNIKNLFPSAKGYGYDYIPLEDIIDEIKPKLGKYELAVIQLPVSSESIDIERVGVTTRIIHDSGQWIEESVFANLTNLSKGSNTQCLGATITYLRRYGLASVFGIAADVNIDTELQGKENIRENYQQKIDEFNQLIIKIDQSIVDPVDKQNVKNLIELINKGKADFKRISNTIELLKKKYTDR